MGQLQTHDMSDLLSVNADGIGVTGSPYPGTSVSYISDRTAFGICISRRWADVKNVCEVLWSKQPLVLDVNVQTINATSRKLKAKWSAESAADINAFAELDKCIARDILYARKSCQQVMEEDADIIDIKMSYDIAKNPCLENIEIKRRSVELRERRTRELDGGCYGAYDGRYATRIRY